MSIRTFKLFQTIQLAAHKMQKVADREIAQKSALTSAQAVALSVIDQKESVSQKYVADALAQRESAITVMVSRLVTLEYITRKRSATDGRAWNLAITPKGRAVLRDVREPFTALMKHLKSEVSVEELKILEEIMSRVSKSFDGQV